MIGKSGPCLGVRCMPYLLASYLSNLVSPSLVINNHQSAILILKSLYCITITGQYTYPTSIATTSEYPTSMTMTDRYATGMTVTGQYATDMTYLPISYLINPVSPSLVINKSRQIIAISQLYLPAKTRLVPYCPVMIIQVGQDNSCTSFAPVILVILEVY